MPRSIPLISSLTTTSTISLFLKDAGIKYEKSLYPWDATWPQQSNVLKERGVTRTGKLPALEYKGKILTQVSTTDLPAPCKVTDNL